MCPDGVGGCINREDRETELGHRRWGRQGRKPETEMGQEDVTGDEVPWERMVSIWREGGRQGPGGLCEGESQWRLPWGFIWKAWQSHEWARGV